MIDTLKNFTSRNINPTLLHLAHEYKNTIRYTIGLCILLAFLIIGVSIHTGGHHSLTKIQGAIEVSGNCSGTYDNVKKEITTPNYPRNYTANKTCYWNIDASPGSRIELRFIDFRLEHSSGCRYDYLQIYDGGSLSANALGPKHCGSTIPRIQISSSNRLYLEWKSDDSLHFSGFKISFHSKSNAPQEECPDRGLSQVDNREVMEKNGWIFNTSHSDMVWMRDLCGEGSWFGFHNSMDASVSTTFKGSGTATLSFGKCLTSPFYKVRVVINGEIKSEAKGNVLEKEISFSFNRGDNLVIKNYEAIIKINSLDITCN